MSKLKETKIEKDYFKIQEVSEIIGVPQSTLRFWEKEFPELKPMRSGTNLRYYTPNDIELLRIIFYLIKTRGLKIEAARQQIRSNKKNVSRRIQIINNLKEIREDLHHILRSLEKIR